MPSSTIAKDYGETSLEAMLHDGKVSYLHMWRRVALESATSIRQFRKEWFAAVKLLFGKTPIPKDLGVDATGAITYWARIQVGLLEDGTWVYRIRVARNSLLAPAFNRVEIIAHEIAHLFDYYNKYVKEGKRPSAEVIKLENKFDFLGHRKEWQAIYRRFYKKLKASDIVKATSDYEKHAALLLEKRRQAWADPDWAKKYKKRMEGEKPKGKGKPARTGRVKAHRRRTEKGKKVNVRSYKRKPKQRAKKDQDFVEFGEKAYKRGVKSAPALDRVLMSQLDGMSHDEFVSAMKKWSKGWMDAHAKKMKL